MPAVARDLVIHEDTENLTYHHSVKFPSRVPLIVDCNEEAVIGTAQLRREGGKVVADLFMRESFPGIPRPFTCLIGCTPETILFDAEDGTNYLIYGGVSYVAVMSGISPVIEPTTELEEAE